MFPCPLVLVRFFTLFLFGRCFLLGFTAVVSSRQGGKCTADECKGPLAVAWWGRGPSISEGAEGSVTPFASKAAAKQLS